MRIIAGSLGGRIFEAPHGHRTHPMSEKIRGALFSTLGDIEGLTVLDAYAGSGALSFEAVSRGADHATAVDIDKSAITAIVNNVRALGVESRVKPIRANISGWMTTDTDSKFDVVLIDPPYDEVRFKVLEAVAKRCKDTGIVVYSLPPNTPFSLPPDRYELLDTKSYGDATLVFYRKIP